MALFSSPSAEQLFPLLRLGFAARLRAETANIYLHQTNDALTSTHDRATATLFHILSGDTLPPTHTRSKNSAGPPQPAPWPERAMLCAVLAHHPSASDETDLSFLSIRPSPRLSDAPVLLRLSVPRGGGNPHRVLISLRDAAAPEHLSLHGAPPGAPVRAAARATKHELFHLEILPSTLGAPLAPIAPAARVSLDHLSVPQAVTHALLQLSVRFRLRSAHGRVLHRDAPPPPADGDKSARNASPAAVLQDGPSSVISETSDRDLLFTPFKTVSPASLEPGAACYALKDTVSGAVLSVAQANADLSRRKTLYETAALLVPDAGAGSAVGIYASRGRWGAVSICKKPGGGRHGDATQPRPEWLMAGARGRLETRPNRSNWESFSLEFVQQSYVAALAEIPVPALYKVADDATRAAVRSEIAAKVAAAKGKNGATGKVRKKGSFNHSAALAGLSDEPKNVGTNSTAKSASKSTAGDPAARAQKKGTAGASAKSAASGAAAAAAGATAASSLPRNQANKKLSKKNKRKAKKAKKAAAAAAASASPAGSKTLKGSPPPATGSSPKNADDDAKNESTDAAEPEKDVSSASSGSASAGTGPPCAACARPVTGTYTKALGKNFHAQCFCCGICRRPMGVGAGQFRERGGTPYCQACYASNLASRCARCTKPVMDTVVTAMEKTWHKDCLTCTICRLPLTQTFWLYADKPNEPRCSRCVTGSEEAVSRGRHGSSRAVNLPMFGRGNNVPSLNVGTGGAGIVPGSAQSGRVRLMAPVLPSTTRR